MKKKNNNGTISIRIGDHNKAFLKALSLFLNTISYYRKYTINGHLIPSNPTFTYILCSGISLSTIDKCVKSMLKTSEWEFATNIIKLFNEMNITISSNEIRKIHSHDIKKLYLNELKGGN